MATGMSVALRDVYRLHIKTASTDRAASIRYCQDRGVIAVGWPVDELPQSWPNYRAAAERIYGRGRFRGAVLLEKLPTGSLAWVREESGKYWIAEVTEEWRYDGSDRAHELDVVNQRPARWHEVGGEADVPGGLLRYYAGRSSTLTAVKAPGVRKHTNLIFGIDIGPISLETAVRDLLAPFDAEDLVSLYFQLEKGYPVYLPDPARRTPAYEFEVRDSSTGRDGVVQVKTGTAIPAFDKLAVHLPERDVWFYAPAAHAPDGRFREITVNDLVAFCRSHAHLLPLRLRRWVDHASH